MSGYRIIIATGYQRIAAALCACLRERHDVVGILTRDTAHEVVGWARENQLPVAILPTVAGEISLKKAFELDRDYAAKISALLESMERPDFLVIWGINVLPDAVVQFPRLKCINIHPSDLPHFRGGFPIQAQIMCGEHKLRLVIHETTDTIDRGAVFARSRWIRLAAKETGNSLLSKILPVAAKLLVKFLDGYSSVSKDSLRLPMANGATRAAWGVQLRHLESIEGKDYYENVGVLRHLRIDWRNASVVEILRAARSFDLLGGVYTNYFNDTYNVVSARRLGSSVRVAPGTILKLIGPDKVAVQAKDGVLALLLRRNTAFSNGSSQPLQVGKRFESFLPIETYTHIKNAGPLVIKER